MDQWDENLMPLPYEMVLIILQRKLEQVSERESERGDNFKKE